MTVESWRRREIQRMGAAISLRSWHDMEKAYNELRDKMDNWLMDSKHFNLPDACNERSFRAGYQAAVDEKVEGGYWPSRHLVFEDKAWEKWRSK